MRNVHDYFLEAGKIWAAYASGKISAVQREARLSWLRAELPSLPLSAEAQLRNSYCAL